MEIVLDGKTMEISEKYKMILDEMVKLNDFSQIEQFNKAMDADIEIINKKIEAYKKSKNNLNVLSLRAHELSSQPKFVSFKYNKINEMIDYMGFIKEELSSYDNNQYIDKSQDVYMYSIDINKVRTKDITILSEASQIVKLRIGGRTIIFISVDTMTGIGNVTGKTN